MRSAVGTASFRVISSAEGACGPSRQIPSPSVPFPGNARPLQGFLESTTDGHGLPYGFHGRGQVFVRLLELFKREAGNLGNHIVDGGLKAGGRFPRDVIPQFVQRIAYGQFGGQFGNGEPCGLGSQRGRAGNAGFISMTIMRPLAGLMANWMLEPPVSTPISRMTAKEASSWPGILGP